MLVGGQSVKIAIVDYTCSSRDYDHHLCEGFAHNGHEVALFGRPLRKNESTKSEKYRYEDIFFKFGERVKSAGLPRGIRRIVKGFEYIAKMKNYARQIQTFEPDIINMQWLFFPFVDKFFIRHIGNKARLVLSVHDSRVNFRGELPWMMYRGWVDTANRFDRIIAMTQHGKERLIKRGVIPEKIRLAPLGLLDFSISEPVAEIDWMPTDTNIVLFFGIVTINKKLDLLLKAFAGMKASTRDSTVLCIAGKADRSVGPLKKLASRLGIESRVLWHQRYIPDNEIPAMFARTDVVAYPFCGVDGSRSLMASLNYGKPLVFSEGGGISEILRDSVHGRIFKEDNIDSFSRALEHMLDNRAERLRMGEAVKKLDREIPTWNDIARDIAGIYEECLS